MHALLPSLSPSPARAPHRARSLLLLALLPLAAGHAAAQAVNLNGNIFDGSGGPLLQGVVYRVIAPITVPPGTTLTVEQGAILKFDAGLYGGHDLTVDGTLLVNGSPGARAIFTSIQDDSAGGDTNGNGPSVGAPGQWQKVRLRATSGASVLRHLEVRFAGGGVVSPCATSWRGSVANPGGVGVTVTRQQRRPARHGGLRGGVLGLTVAGEPRIGETLTFTVQSYAGLSFYFVGALDGRFNWQPYGMVNAGLSPVVFAAVPVGTPVSVPIPDDQGLVGVEVGIQTVTFPLSTFLFGNVTRLCRVKVRG